MRLRVGGECFGVAPPLLACPRPFPVQLVRGRDGGAASDPLPLLATYRVPRLPRLLCGFARSSVFPPAVAQACHASRRSPSAETKILGNVQDLPKGIARENRIIQTVMRQLLFALDGPHSTGIVHRDIKPQNVIFSEEYRTFKIIDLGVAADLRVGINYIPKEFLLDPRYAAPEQYIMSTQTPSAPSAPVATALSAVLWQLNLPDRFDIYSLGLIFLQMAFPALGTYSSLIQFNRQLKRCNYDLEAWRDLVEPRATPDLRRGFEILVLDGGIGWELLTFRYKARQRTSAKAALAHPYFNSERLLSLSVMQNLRLQLFRATQKDYSEAARWVVGLMAKSGTEAGGGFTEAQLQELREIKPKKDSAQRNVLASMLRVQRKGRENDQRVWTSSPASAKASAGAGGSPGRSRDQAGAALYIVQFFCNTVKIDTYIPPSFTDYQLDSKPLEIHEGKITCVRPKEKGKIQRTTDTTGRPTQKMQAARKYKR